MKKLLGILVLGLLVCSNAFSSEDIVEGLIGIKKMYVTAEEVNHDEDYKCEVEASDITATMLYVLNSSEIKIAKEYTERETEILYFQPNIFDNEDLCIGNIKIMTMTVGSIKNSAGHKFNGLKVSYNSDYLWTDNIPNFKKSYLDQVEKMIEDLVFEWKRANK